MLDIPAELFIMISTYLDYQDVQALMVTLRFICQLLLPEYLRRCGLVLNDTCGGGLGVELRNLSGYASLGLWSAVRILHSPKEMYCSIPCDAQEARSAMRFLMCFLLEPSNSCNLRDFHLSLHGSNPFLLASEFIKFQRLFYTLPLTRLCLSGYVSVDYLPPSVALRSGPSCSSQTLTSLVISSDYAFAPGLVQTTMGILKRSPIETLVIYMVSLKPPQWSTLLGELNMAFLENVELEGDIPQPPLIRFLIKHTGLKSVRIGCNAPSDRTQPSRSRCQPFLPNLLTLKAPLAVCCDIAERVGNSSSLYHLEVELKQLNPHDPTFRRLLEMLWHFQKLDHLGLRLRPSTTPQAPLNGYDWEGFPVRELRQIRSLSFFWGQGRLSPGDIVGCHLSSLLPCLTQVTGHDVRLREIISNGRKRLRG